MRGTGTTAQTTTFCWLPPDRNRIGCSIDGVTTSSRSTTEFTAVRSGRPEIRPRGELMEDLDSHVLAGHRVPRRPIRTRPVATQEEDAVVRARWTEPETKRVAVARRVAGASASRPAP